MNITDAIAGILILWGIIWGTFIPACLILVALGFILLMFSYMFLSN